MIQFDDHIFSTGLKPTNNQLNGPKTRIALVTTRVFVRRRWEGNGFAGHVEGLGWVDFDGKKRWEFVTGKGRKDSLEGNTHPKKL